MKYLIKFCLVIISLFMVNLATAKQMPDYALASKLATKSKSLVTSRSHVTNISFHEDKTRQNRNSVIDPSYKEAQCGGVAIANVRPKTAQDGHKKVVVVITGNIINTANQC